MTINNANTATL